MRRHPAGAVIDEDPLTAGGAARGHRAVCAEIERVVTDRLEVAEQLANLRRGSVTNSSKRSIICDLVRMGARTAPPSRAAGAHARMASARSRDGRAPQSLALEALDPLAGPALTLGELPACSQGAMS